MAIDLNQVPEFNPQVWLDEYRNAGLLSPGQFSHNTKAAFDINDIYGNRNAGTSQVQFLGAFTEDLETERLNQGSGTTGYVTIAVFAASLSFGTGFAPLTEAIQPQIDDKIEFCGGKFLITKVRANGTNTPTNNQPVIAWFCDCRYYPGEVTRVTPTPIVRIHKFNPMKFNPRKFA